MCLLLFTFSEYWVNSKWDNIGTCFLLQNRPRYENKLIEYY